MGSASRPKPARLAEKLLEIRQKLGLSQNGIARHLGLDSELGQERISKYERGILEPPLYVLCAYAEAANAYMEVLVKDDLNLPEELPAKQKSEGIRHEGAKKRKKRSGKRVLLTA
jgi:transcriptional regulator with XRE-family HTH domain